MNFLKISNHLFFLIAICWTTSVFSQSKLSENTFPIAGLFKVQKNELNEPKRYNYIDFKDDTYALILDEEKLFVFQAVALNNDEYVLKQLSAGNLIMDENSDPINIRLKINVLEENKIEIFFIYADRTEKITLIKA